MTRRLLAVVLASLCIWPSLAFGQGAPAGVVTTLEGNVTARRTASTTPIALKFRDDVFMRDTITTGDKSLARMLLGGKAVVTVRERSVLTITESPGRSNIELASGKFALAVAREKMTPGEEIQIRTPNAVAGVRGTVVITEILQATAQTGGPTPGVVTNFHVLRGTIAAGSLNQPGPLNTVGPLTSARIAGATPPVLTPIPPEQISQITAGLQPSGKSGGTAGESDIKTQAVQTAAGLATVIAGGQEPLAVVTAAVPARPVTTEQGPTVAPVTPLTAPAETVPELIATAGCLTCTRISGQSISLSGQPLVSLTGSFINNAADPLLSIDSSSVDHHFSTFIDVGSGATVGLSGPFATVVNTDIFTTGTFLNVAGQITSLGSGPLVVIDPSFVNTGDALIALNGATVNLAGPLITDVSGTLAINTEFIRMHNSTLTSTTLEPLVQLTGSDISAASGLTMTNSHVQLAGPLANLVGIGSAGFDSAFSAPLFGVNDNSTVISTTTAPLIQMASTGIDHDHSIFQITNGSSVTTNGALFGLTDSGLGAAFRIVELIGGAAPATLTLGGPLLTAVDVEIEAPSGLVGVFNGSSLTSTTTLPLIALTGTGVLSSPSSPGQGAILGASGTGPGGAVNTISLHGPLLNATDSTLILDGNIIDLFDGSTLTSSTTAPLVSIVGGDPHSFGTRALVHLQGRPSTATGTFDYEIEFDGGPQSFTLTNLGTDRMLSTGGTVLEVDNASVTSSQAAVTVDTALLEASAPLLDLKNGASVALGLHGVNLVKQARLDVIGPLVRLDNSTLTILAGHAVSVAGGSLLNVTGPLLALTNSTLNLNNGALLAVTGNSVANISGALLAFGGGSNTVNITNSLCPGSCFLVNGINVALIGGAGFDQVSVGPNVVTGTGTINLSGPTTAHVVVSGPSSKVKIAQ